MSRPAEGQQGKTYLSSEGPQQKPRSARAAGQLSLKGTFAFMLNAPVLGGGSLQEEWMQDENLRLMLF